MGQSCVTQLEDRSCKNPTFTNYSNDVVNNVQRAEKKQEKTVLLSFDNLDKQIIELLLARSKKFHLGITHSQSRTSEEHNQVFLNYALNFWHGMQDSKQPFRLNPPADIRIRFGSNYQCEIDQQKQWIFGLEDKVFHFMAIGKSSDFDTTILTQFARKGNITPSKQFQKAIKTLLLKYLKSTLASRFQSVCKSLKCCILVNALDLCSNQSIQKVLNMKIQFRKDGLKHDDEKIILRLCSIDWQDQVRDCVHNARDLVGQMVRLRPGIEPYTSIGWFVWYSFHSCLQPQQQLWELFLFYVGNVFETGRFFDFALEKMLLYTASEVIKECDFEAAILCCKWNNYVESIELNLVALNANVALNGIDICHVTMDSITAAMAITAREFEQYLVTNKVIHVSLQHQQQFEECLSNQRRNGSLMYTE
ncbi:unnamed protein product [Albugo candida]|uniref:Uncharacterized protein n=1 Tax=Albugo candida TaxID=65357 RepID=A0A024G0D6_9STRA|nr:unnamed protein product [Albugo candida]|eukprot:CCI40229.1 unnamed protein product [Albugo candida]